MKKGNDYAAIFGESKFNSMTIKDLKEVLINLPDNMEVVLQKDNEGGGYNPLAGTDIRSICSQYDVRMSEEEWNNARLKFKVLVLYPVD